MYLKDLILYPLLLQVKGWVIKGNEIKLVLFVTLGRKVFTNSLVAKEIRSLGGIDGVDTKKLVTLSTDQRDIPGTIVFKDIEVVQQLNVSIRNGSRYAKDVIPKSFNFLFMKKQWKLWNELYM